MKDEELIQNFKKGNNRSFELIYEKYKRSLLKLIWYYVNRKEDAEDILQSVFYKVVKNIHKFKPEKGASFKTWLYRIAINSCKDFLRTRKQEIGIDFIDDMKDTSSTDEIEDKLMVEKIRKEVFKLPIKYREVIVMIYFEGMQYNEAAEILKKPVGTIKSRLNYGINLLKNRMGVNDEK